MDDEMEPLFGADDLALSSRGRLPTDLQARAVMLKRRCEKSRVELDQLLAWAKVNDPAMYARLMKPF
jgi:hypothetical protein